MTLLAATASLAPLAVQAEAHAASCDTTEAAEMLRLRGELSKFAVKNLHSGVISTFQKMLALGKQKCEVKPDDYKVGANGARNAGDIGTAITWFNGGGATAEAAELATRFGQVAISEKAGDLVKDGGMPFPPDERAALDAGTQAIKANGKYTGYLPIGTYKLGGKSFEVKTSGVTKV
jgi:hypothetical protein